MTMPITDSDISPSFSLELTWARFIVAYAGSAVALVCSLALRVCFKFFAL